jgi:hypothetical protein
MKAVRLIKTKVRELPTAEYVTITPELAQTWLDTMGRQRKFNHRTGIKYAEILKRGDWMVSNDAVTCLGWGRARESSC